MTDIRTLKKEVIITDNSLSVTQRTAIDDHILTDDIIVANNDVGLISTEIGNPVAEAAMTLP